jgi:hypothetical protein
MRRFYPVRLASLVVLAAATLAWPLQAPAQHVSAAAGIPSASDFDTTLTGSSTPVLHGQKYMVTLQVTRQPGDKTVQLSISLNAGGLTNIKGSSYTFMIPAKDLTVSAGKSASLDTRKDLGAYGRITAKWTFTPSTAATPTATPTADACNPYATGGGNITRINASYTATISLNFPCEHAVQGTLAGTTEIDNGGIPATSSSTSVSSLTYKAAMASQAATKQTISVIGYRMGDGSGTIMVSVTLPSNASTGLTNSQHFAMDKIVAPASSLSIANSTATIAYSGVLGSAKLAFNGRGSPYSLSRPVKCYNPNASKADLAKSVQTSISQATVSGPVNMTACVPVKTTFVLPDPKKGVTGDTGTIISMVLTSQPSSSIPTVAVTPPAGTTPVAGQNTPTTGAGGTVTVTSSTPANGATGVSLTPSFSITLSAAPPGPMMMVVMPAASPTGMSGMKPVMPVPATFDSSNTAAGTLAPGMTLDPNTQYQLQLRSLTNPTGAPVATVTFTTGAS